ncbi:MAG: hypothetical protein U0T80_10690 [Flavobacteriaceae bacterium]
MKKILFLLLAAVIFTSCSTDSDSTDSSFFNLNNGNLWVYKRYYSSDNINYMASGQIDSVRVEGDTVINSISYSKLVHRIYQANVFSYQRKDFLKVDTNGHLVNETGYVLHPGTDMSYQGFRNVTFGQESNTVGTITEQLQNPFETNVEGVSYYVYSYYGNFISSVASIPNNYIFYQCKEGVGLVNQHCSSVSGTLCYEDRLVYYDLN